MYLDSTHPAETAVHDVRPVPGICSLSITAPAHAVSVGTLRSRASALFAGWAMSDDEQSTAALVISELLTNAVIHGHDQMTLQVALTTSELEIMVTDHGRPKNSAPPGDPEEHGRGLSLVAALTHDLRIDQMATGWRTRARIDLATAPPATASARPTQGSMT
ncbi:ATP-binding protein [Streptomyces sp. NPDC049597]|uniref:ATP-binding protein n=1 Tax=Streptomyces sp. NPDC049597 TaxID=3155276 RepID=UPI00341DBC89